MNGRLLDPRALNDDFRLTALHQRPRLRKGLDAALERLRGRMAGGHRRMRAILETARGIDEASKACRNMSDADLRRRLESMRAVFRRGGRSLEGSREEALALVQEATHRTLGFRPHPEQLAGALALERGFVAEMATGEGKTVTIAMAAVLRGWSGFPCHVLTANDYLADRDARIMEPLYALCDVTVGSVVSGMEPPQRLEGYRKDVTYTTAGEVLADFLRDRIALGRDQDYQKRSIRSAFGAAASATRGVVMRGIHTAIVDEADNVLIDEAVTPLIISRQEPNDAFARACRTAADIASRLERGVDYALDEPFRTVRFLRSIDGAIQGGPDTPPNLFAGPHFQLDLVRQALVAREFFLRDRQYVVEDGKVVIVDESTGRKMPMRTWSAGLHQLVEMKEGLDPTPVQETQARMSFQRFFRFYKVFSGMTGTGKEASGEFWQVYGLPVVPVPNHRPSRRVVHPLRGFAREEEKWEAIVEEIESVHATGRPILAGTRSVRQSEQLAARLDRRGLPCQVVNAVRQSEEADVIAVAGRRGAITVATNMAGRGTDIRVPPDVEELGGLHVIATECHGSSRIDRQLFGRCARQGDRGSVTPYTSMEDDLLVENLPASLRHLLARLRGAFPTLSDRLAAHSVRAAQSIAQRKDARSRFSVQETDTWLDDSLSFSQDDVH